MSQESSAIFGNYSGIGPFVDTFWQPKEGPQLQRAALICWVATTEGSTDLLGSDAILASLTSVSVRNLFVKLDRCSSPVFLC